jgi:DNA-binding transcriptional ArsR family regulator
LSTVEAAPFRLPRKPTKSDILAKYFRGFGEPTRLEILELLQDEGEMSVQEIVEAVRTSQPRVSNHLACLRWCGFVETRREQRTIYYSVADRRVSKMIDLGRSLLEDNEEHVAACKTIG